MAITYLTAKEGNTQGDVVVARSVQSLDIPANTFTYPAIIPDQEAAKQGHLGKMINLYNRTLHTDPQKISRGWGFS